MTNYNNTKDKLEIEINSTLKCFLVCDVISTVNL